MKITKFVHSCVLVEHDGQAALFDPGVFSWNSGLVDIDKLPQINTVIITHKHPDHCYEPFVRELIQKFPEIQWIAPSDVHDELQAWGAGNITNQSVEDIVVREVDHAPVEPFGVQVNNLIVHWKGLVTDPGDTHDLNESKELLLLPVQAPWGTTIRAIELVNQLKPKYIFPIHDWMWNDDWRDNAYDRFEIMFKDSVSNFLRPENGKTLEVDLS